VTTGWFGTTSTTSSTRRVERRRLIRTRSMVASDEKRRESTAKYTFRLPGRGGVDERAGVWRECDAAVWVRRGGRCDSVRSPP
jgi:hypothetical protein